MRKVVSLCSGQLSPWQVVSCPWCRHSQAQKVAPWAGGNSSETRQARHGGSVRDRYVMHVVHSLKHVHAIAYCSQLLEQMPLPRGAHGPCIPVFITRCGRHCCRVNGNYSVQNGSDGSCHSLLIGIRYCSNVGPCGTVGVPSSQCCDVFGYSPSQRQHACGWRTIRRAQDVAAVCLHIYLALNGPSTSRQTVPKRSHVGIKVRRRRSHRHGSQGWRGAFTVRRRQCGCIQQRRACRLHCASHTQVRQGLV